MALKSSLGNAIRDLEGERTKLAKQLDAIDAAIATLKQANRGTPSAASRSKRRLSPAGRAAISKAAKKRWAKYNAQKKKQARRRR